MSSSICDIEMARITTAETGCVYISFLPADSAAIHCLSKRANLCSNLAIRWRHYRWVDEICTHNLIEPVMPSAKESLPLDTSHQRQTKLLKANSEPSIKRTTSADGKSFIHQLVTCVGNLFIILTLCTPFFSPPHPISGSPHPPSLVRSSSSPSIWPFQSDLS